MRMWMGAASSSRAAISMSATMIAADARRQALRFLVADFAARFAAGARRAITCDRAPARMPVVLTATLVAMFAFAIPTAAPAWTVEAAVAAVICANAGIATSKPARASPPAAVSWG